MPRLSTSAAKARRDSIVAALLRAEQPLKAIAHEHGITLNCVRQQLWLLGFRCMHLTAEERQHIAARRRAASRSQQSAV
jgi:hypothetical protein